MKKSYLSILLLLVSFVTCSAQDTLSVRFIGDVMMHSRQLEHDCSKFLEKLSPDLQKADISVANMEFTMSGKPYTGYPSFSAPDRYASCLADWGVDVLLTANNHILDKGDRGLLRTLHVCDSLESAGRLRYTGCGADPMADSLHNPLILEKNGVRLALVNFTYGTNCSSPSPWPKVHRLRKEMVQADMRRARRAGADFVIVLPHWGTEYALEHSKEQEGWAKLFCSEGADLIIGSHPHVVQDTSHIGRVPVFYSLGNSVSNMSAINTRLGMMVTVKFVCHPGGRREMLPPEYEWTWCCLPGMLDGTFRTIPVKDYISRSDLWKNRDDWANMVQTIKRIEKK